ncbi:murein DD-endopeptidase MepM/ murein hydrolase activator NlpD [Pseudomonas duriflava]|uniref:Murein DD-endopeptidase MepM/ murein hydrolase activator NlpD n=1 Tax=Pseudomonas duriflava TaxID=459528 RepID=A0A562QE27_9PSED|nr:M23 family metallopeptidase [Pseudomonas duriflava]TWI54991.1 murein DD-endopeptidase MepM/ murein hydrolase activator NlpD [Pseudomonas duriflava]
MRLFFLSILVTVLATSSAWAELKPSATASTSAKASASASAGLAKPPKSRNGGVRLVTRRAKGGQVFDVSNSLDVPVTVTLRLSRMVNVAGAGKGTIRQTIPANSQVRIASLQKRQQGYPMHFKQAFSFSPHYSPGAGGGLGNPDSLAGITTGYAYALPWQGGPFYISQGANGDFSHHTPKGRYAVDVAMPEGTAVVAARGGTVIEIENRQFGHGPSPSGNFVRILHDDGTQSAYLHLKRGSVMVREGQTVKTGTPLAQSGNTGRSTGPHLHFVVQQAAGDAVVSIPFRFAQPVAALPNFALGGNE